MLISGEILFKNWQDYQIEHSTSVFSCFFEGSVFQKWPTETSARVLLLLVRLSWMVATRSAGIAMHGLLEWDLRI